MSNVGEKAFRIRRWLLALVVLVECGVGGWLLTGTDSHGRIIIATMVFFATQFFFLGRRENWPVHLANRSAPLRRTTVIGAAIATGLTVGGIATLLEVPDLWHEKDSYLSSWFDFYAVIGLTWVLWAVGFAFLWPGIDRYTWLTRMVRRLIVGSVLELLASISVQAFVPDRHDCTCARGSFLGIVIGSVALLWTFGPGIVLLFLYEKVRMERGNLHRRCAKCDYDLRGTLDAGRAECPECGTAVVSKTA